MQEIFLANLQVSVNNIFHNFHGFIFEQFSFFLEVGAQISLVAEFCDDVAVASLPDDIIASEDILVFEFGQGFDLAIEHFPTDAVLDSLHVNGFDCDDLIWF